MKKEARNWVFVNIYHGDLSIGRVSMRRVIDQNAKANGHSNSCDATIDFIIGGNNAMPNSQVANIKKSDYSFGNEAAFPEYAGNKYFQD